MKKGKKLLTFIVVLAVSMTTVLGTGGTMLGGSTARAAGTSTSYKDIVADDVHYNNFPCSEPSDGYGLIGDTIRIGEGVDVWYVINSTNENGNLRLPYETIEVVSQTLPDVNGDGLNNDVVTLAQNNGVWKATCVAEGDATVKITYDDLTDAGNKVREYTFVLHSCKEYKFVNITFVDQNGDPVNDQFPNEMQVNSTRYAKVDVVKRYINADGVLIDEPYTNFRITSLQNANEDFFTVSGPDSNDILTVNSGVCNNNENTQITVEVKDEDNNSWVRNLHLNIIGFNAQFDWMNTTIYDTENKDCLFMNGATITGYTDVSYEIGSPDTSNGFVPFTVTDSPITVLKDANNGITGIKFIGSELAKIPELSNERMFLVRLKVTVGTSSFYIDQTFEFINTSMKRYPELYDQELLLTQDLFIGEFVTYEDYQYTWHEAEVTDVKVASGNAVSVVSVDGGWSIVAEKEGKADITVTHKTQDGISTEDYTFTVDVVEKQMFVEVSIDAPDRNYAFPGDVQEWTLTTYVNKCENGEIVQEDVTDEATYTWNDESNLITIKLQPVSGSDNKVKVVFDESAALDEVVFFGWYVEWQENANEEPLTYQDSTGICVTDEYKYIKASKLPSNFELFDEVELDPVVISASYDFATGQKTETPVTSDLEFYWEWDSSVVTLYCDGKEVEPSEAYDSNSTYTVKRLNDFNEYESVLCLNAVYHSANMQWGEGAGEFSWGLPECSSVVTQDVPKVDTSTPVTTVTPVVEQATANVVAKEAATIVDTIIEAIETEDAQLVADLKKVVDEEVIEAIIEALEDGEVITTEITATTLTEDELMKTAASDMTEILKLVGTDGEVAQYLDLAIWIKSVDADGNETKLGTINALTESIEFTVMIPDELDKNGRTFYVIRVHDGKAERLPVKKDGKQITFSTDRFSIYALAYEDSTEEDDSGNDGNVGNTDNTDNNSNTGNTGSTGGTAESPKTGDIANTVPMATYIALGAAIVVLLASIRLKRAVRVR